ncbi:MAG: hypothetical protein ACREMP_09840 [Candidatus Tyrphobacter sp.]
MHDDYHLDFSEVPESKGIPRGIVLTVAIGFVVIFLIGAGVVLLSGHGHMWPALTTLREPLK